jgi:hypothetical protein
VVKISIHGHAPPLCEIYRILKLLNLRELESLKEKWWNQNPEKKQCDDGDDQSDGISIYNIGKSTTDESKSLNQKKQREKRSNWKLQSNTVTTSDVSTQSRTENAFGPTPRLFV